MASKRRFAPTFEVLEDRLAPAVSLSFLGGNLTIRGNGGSNNLMLVAVGTDITVTNNASGLGTYSGTGNVTVLMGNGTDTVSLDATAGSIAGNYSVNTGNSADLVTITGNGAANSVGGFVTINTGRGNDTITLTAVRIGGNTLVDGSLGSDTVTVVGASTIGGLLSVSRANDTTVGDGATAASFGRLVVNNSSDGLGSNFVLADLATVSGGLTFIGGNGIDAVDIEGDVAGSVSALLGESANVFTLGAAANVAIGGDLTVLSGGSADLVALDLGGTGSTIGGRASLNLGNGDNTVLTAFLNVAFSINGDFNVVGGGGIDSVTPFSGNVGGSMTLNLGHGANDLTVIDGAVIGGNLSYTGGSGVDAVALVSIFGGAVSIGGQLRANLGAGADVVSFVEAAAPGTLVLGSTYLDFGVDADTDVYISALFGGAAVTWPQTIVNYP